MSAQFDRVLAALGVTYDDTKPEDLGGVSLAASQRMHGRAAIGIVESLSRATGVALCGIPDCGCDGLEHP